ncbi:MAG: hypothetical protein HY695_07590 [Deltaproteobacteria bacterium]|nr:hypothetical protein [Deltaproteobacteria bacterium]
MIALTPWCPKLAQILCAVGSLTLILDSFGAVPGVFAAEAHQLFASFNPKVEIDIEDGEIEVMATFRLGASSNGLDPATEMVALQLKGGGGACSITIPAGSFKMDGSGGFKFYGTINRVKIVSSIRPLRGGGFEFEVETEGANLKGMATVSLIIGDDGGSRAVRAKID